MPAQGETLSTTTGTWTQSPSSFGYQWNRGGVAIGGATSGSYLIAAADVGTTLTVTVTATNAAGSVPATSAATGTVTSAAGGATLDPMMDTPILFITTGNLVYPPQFDIAGLEDAAVSDSITLEWRNNVGTLIGSAVNTIDAAEATAMAATFTGLSSITTGTHRFTAFRTRGSTYSSNSNQIIQGPDDAAPVLTLLSSLMVSATTGKALFTTDTGEGPGSAAFTLTNVVPSQATMNASPFTLAITTTGAKEITGTGLTASTLYYAWVQHTDVAGNATAITAAGSFTTDAVVAFSLTETAAPADANVNNAATTATFTTQPIGAAGSSRRVLVGVTLYDTSGTFPNAVSIGGVAATKLNSVGAASIWMAAVPTGTTATVIVTSTQTIDACAIKVFRLVGANPVPTESPVTATAFVADPTIAVTTPAGGASLIYALSESLSDVAAMVNATLTTSSATKYWAHAGGIRTTAGAATVTVDWSAGVNNKNVQALSFAP